MKKIASRLLACMIAITGLVLQNFTARADGGNGITMTTPHTDTTICAGDSIHLQAVNAGYHSYPSGITSDDGFSGVIPIGFNFNFYGNTYSHCIISANGLIKFDTALAGGYSPWPISTALPGNTDCKNSIMACYCDIYLLAGGNVTYGVAGTAPNRRFVVNFCTTALYSCTTLNVSFQVILYETTNVIEVHMRHKDVCTTWNSGYGIQGLEDTSGYRAVATPGRNFPSVWGVYAPEGKRFTPDSVFSTYTIDSIGYNPISQDSSSIYWYAGATYLGTGSGITVAPTATTVYKAISYSCSDTSSSTRTLNIAPRSAGTISGPSAVCVGSTITLTDPISGGTWSSSSVSIASVSSAGIVTGVNNGTANITYTVRNACGTFSAIHTVNVSRLSGTIVGSSTVCVGSTITLMDSVSGGSWTSSDATIASISAAGVVTGVAAGTATISYYYTGGCGSGLATKTINVSTAPSHPSAISGPSSVCVGASITLSDGTTGVTWSSSNTAIATVNPSSGAVTGISAGTVNITCGVSNACGSAYVVATLTVNPLPAAPSTISGSSTVCVGNTISLSDATSGGTWSSSATGVASVGSTGVVTGVSAGTATISYIVYNSCGSALAYKYITVSGTPTVSGITGSTTVCVGASTTLADATTGGTWSSTALGTASVNASSGIVTGVGAGTATISYAITNACGTTAATANVTVTNVPAITAISGPSTVCRGTSATLTDATGGGTWSSTLTSVGTVSSTGVVTAVATGTTTISYTLTNSCGTAAATKSITVSTTPSAGSITGATSVCSGATFSLTDGVAGGTWSTASTTVATVNSSGVVTGIAAGTTTVSYSVTSTCGSAVATATLTVNPAPAAGTITGGSSICAGASSVLSDAATGGTWSTSAASIASVSTSGVVSGILAGTAVISYSVTNGCGTAVATKGITVNALPAPAAIAGPTTVCSGATIALSDATGGGTWSSSNAAIATVSASGVVTGVASGTVSISYTISGSCGTATVGAVISVGGAPSVAAIGGPTSGCTGASVTLTDATTGGVWTSGTPSVATINASTGVVSCVATGTTNITYTVTSSCATAYATRSLTISGSATAGAISGLTSVCTGSTVTLTSSGTAGGSWSSSNNAIATVSGGVVRGVSAGTITISYSVTSGCGTAVATKTVSVTTTPSVVAISGPSSICVGTSSAFSDASTGGGWISSNTAIATVNSAGVVTGISAGTITLTYFVTNTCGTATTTKSVTVNTLTAGVIGGTSSIVVGSSTTFTNTVSGGVWSVSNTALASIAASSGVFTAAGSGIDTVKYTVTGSCGSATATKAVNITAHRGAPAAIPTQEDVNVNLYPNPNTGSFTIDVNCVTCNTTVMITDLTGKQMTSLSSTEKLISFDISEYPKGIYIVLVNTGDNTFTKKIVLQ